MHLSLRLLLSGRSEPDICYEFHEYFNECCDFIVLARRHSLQREYCFLSFPEERAKGEGMARSVIYITARITIKSLNITKKFDGSRKRLNSFVNVVTIQFLTQYWILIFSFQIHSFCLSIQTSRSSGQRLKL